MQTLDTLPLSMNQVEPHPAEHDLRGGVSIREERPQEVVAM